MGMLDTEQLTTAKPPTIQETKRPANQESLQDINLPLVGILANVLCKFLVRWFV